MFAVPPLAAEKLLVSGYALTLLAGVWYLTGAVRPGGSRWLAFLAFPFVFNFLFQFGFYNFSLSLALFPFVLGFWWRYRERPAVPRYVVGINLLLWLCYFSHILSFGLALLAIAILWLATLRRDNWRRHLRHVAVLAPQGFLPVWYFSMEGGSTTPSFWPFGRLLRFFVQLGALPSFGPPQELLSELLALAFLVLLLLTLRREGLRRPQGSERAFLLLAAVFTLLYFVSPDGMSGGTMLKNRLCLYPYLILIPWLAPGFGPRGRRARRRRAGRRRPAQPWLRGPLVPAAERRDGRRTSPGSIAVEPDTRILPLLFTHQAHGAEVDVLNHAMSYKRPRAGAGRLGQLRGGLDVLPDRVPRRNHGRRSRRSRRGPAPLRTKEWRHRADYIYTWRMPSGHSFSARLRSGSTTGSPRRTAASSGRRGPKDERAPSPPPLLRAGPALRAPLLGRPPRPDHRRPQPHLQRLGAPELRRRRALPPVPAVLRDQPPPLPQLDQPRGDGAPDVRRAAGRGGEAAGERLRADLPRRRLVSRRRRAAGGALARLPGLPVRLPPALPVRLLQLLDQRRPLPDHPRLLVAAPRAPRPGVRRGDQPAALALLLLAHPVVRARPDRHRRPLAGDAAAGDLAAPPAPRPDPAPAARAAALVLPQAGPSGDPGGLVAGSAGEVLRPHRGAVHPRQGADRVRRGARGPLPGADRPLLPARPGGRRTRS